MLDQDKAAEAVAPADVPAEMKSGIELPSAITKEETLSLFVNNEKENRLAAQVEVAELKLIALRKELTEHKGIKHDYQANLFSRYKVKDGDQIDLATGKITRI